MAEKIILPRVQCQKIVVKRCHRLSLLVHPWGDVCGICDGPRGRTWHNNLHWLCSWWYILLRNYLSEVLEGVRAVRPAFDIPILWSNGQSRRYASTLLPSGLAERGIVQTEPLRKWLNFANTMIGFQSITHGQLHIPEIKLIIPKTKSTYLTEHNNLSEIKNKEKRDSLRNWIYLVKLSITTYIQDYSNSYSEIEMQI